MIVGLVEHVQEQSIHHHVVANDAPRAQEREERPTEPRVRSSGPPVRDLPINLELRVRVFGEQNGTSARRRDGGRVGNVDRRVGREHRERNARALRVPLADRLDAVHLRRVMRLRRAQTHRVEYEPWFLFLYGRVVYLPRAVDTLGVYHEADTILAEAHDVEHGVFLAEGAEQRVGDEPLRAPRGLHRRAYVRVLDEPEPHVDRLDARQRRLEHAHDLGDLGFRRELVGGA